MDEREQCVRQATIALPYFHYELPVLYLGDGTPYIPVIALCEMLGLRAETHIPRWRKLLLWANARKLPLSTTRGKRIVWCLNLGALPFWCVCFNWSLVAPIRREQLLQASDAWRQDIANAHQLMMDSYRSLRKSLFVFLVTYSDMKDRFRHWQLLLSPTLDIAASRHLEMLIWQGCMIIDQASALARKMLHEQAITPIVDVVTFNAVGEVTGLGTIPLFPVVHGEEREQFCAYMSQLIEWHKAIVTFLDKFIFS